jgi:endonuclease-3
MSAVQKTKASDRQGVCKKLVKMLRQRYKKPISQEERPILEAMLFAICLEDTPADEAESAYVRLTSGFHDLNEVRVSSISELAAVFDGVGDAERRALSVRSVLRYVFEKNFQFEFENLRKKTLEQATKQLQRIKDVSPFVRAYILQFGLGSHLVPVDDSMRRAAVWLGLVDSSLTVEEASEALKAAVRKADAPQFCQLLRCLATDPAVRDAFKPKGNAPEGSYDLQTAPARLAELFASADSRPARKPGKEIRKKSVSSDKKRSSGQRASKTTSRKKPAAGKASQRAKSKRKK